MRTFSAKAKNLMDLLAKRDRIGINGPKDCQQARYLPIPTLLLPFFDLLQVLSFNMKTP